jgi:hypothetical protein
MAVYLYLAGYGSGVTLPGSALSASLTALLIAGVVLMLTVMSALSPCVGSSCPRKSRTLPPPERSSRPRGNVPRGRLIFYLRRSQRTL